VEDRLAIAAEDELDEAVAESADAVVEEDGVGHGTLETLAAAKSKAPPYVSPRNRETRMGRPLETYLRA